MGPRPHPARSMPHPSRVSSCSGVLFENEPAERYFMSRRSTPYAMAALPTALNSLRCLKRPPEHVWDSSALSESPLAGRFQVEAPLVRHAQPMYLRVTICSFSGAPNSSETSLPTGSGYPCSPSPGVDTIENPRFQDLSRGRRVPPHPLHESKPRRGRIDPTRPLERVLDPIWRPSL